MQTSRFTNIAFISYKREDERWAKWLQKKLEHYKLPTEIRKQNPNLEFAKNPRHVFKDTTDLSGGVLAKAIKEGLDSSKYLIVICSPRAAKSPWVCKEVQEFINSGREEYIIPFIVEGEPNAREAENECFPEALKALAGERELLGININENGRESAAVKVVSRLFGLRFDTLWDRFQREKRRRAIGIGIAIIATLFIGIGTLTYLYQQKQKVEIAKYETSAQEAYSHYLECQKLLEESQYAAAYESARDMLQKYDHVLTDSLHDRCEFILRKSYHALNADTPTLVRKTKAEFPEMDWGDMPVTFSEREHAIYIGCSGLSRIDMNTGKKLAFNSDWPSEIKIGKDNIVCFDNLTISLYDKNSLDKLGETNLGELLGTTSLLYVSSTNRGERCLLYNSDTRTFIVFDTFHKNIISTFPSAYGQGSISGDGKTLALIENEQFKLYDTETGNDVHYTDGRYAHELQFDQSGNWLLLYLKQTEHVRILNLKTKEDYFLDVDIPEQEWGSSFNFSGQVYGNKYIVSGDGKYVTIAGKVYDMAKGCLFFELKNPDLAQGVMITNDAKQIVQINIDKTIYTYTRKGKNLFETCQIDYEKYIDEYQMPEGITGNSDSDIIFYNNNKFIGKIANLFTDVYMICVTNDKKYALVSALNKPTTLYSIKTGLPIEEYPHSSEGWDSAFIGSDGCFYFPTLNTVYKYNFIPLETLLQTEIRE